VKRVAPLQERRHGGQILWVRASGKICWATQAIRPGGDPAQDFRLTAQPNALHVPNAPSRAATAPVPIERRDRSQRRLAWCTPTHIS